MTAVKSTAPGRRHNIVGRV